MAFSVKLSLSFLVLFLSLSFPPSIASTSPTSTSNVNTTSPSSSSFRTIRAHQFLNRHELRHSDLRTIISASAATKKHSIPVGGAAFDLTLVSVAKDKRAGDEEIVEAGERKRYMRGLRIRAEGKKKGDNGDATRGEEVKGATVMMMTMKKEKRKRDEEVAIVPAQVPQGNGGIDTSGDDGEEEGTKNQGEEETHDEEKRDVTDVLGMVKQAKVMRQGMQKYGGQLKNSAILLQSQPNPNSFAKRHAFQNKVHSQLYHYRKASSDLPPITSFLRSVKTSLDPAAEQYGRKNLDWCNEAETVLMAASEDTKDMLADVDLMVYSAPILGDVLGPLVYDIKCVIDDVLDILTNTADGLINSNPLLSELSASLGSTACRLVPSLDGCGDLSGFN